MVPASRNPAALERFALLPLLLAALAVPALAAGPVVVPAALRSASPAGMRRGTTILFTLGGVNIRDATAVMFDDPGITGSIRRLADPNRNQVQVAVTAGAGVRPGIHSLSLRTPMGVTGGVSFAVGAWAEVGEKEPDDDPASAP